jgi:hypothetical protein
MFYLSAQPRKNGTEIMSLIKIYAVGCEGLTLVERLRVLNRLSGVQVSYREHQSFSSYATSSQKSRRRAISEGWSRRTVTLPIFSNQPDGPSTDVKFDLCPSCTKILKDVK